MADDFGTDDGTDDTPLDPNDPKPVAPIPKVEPLAQEPAPKPDAPQAEPAPEPTYTPKEKNVGAADAYSDTGLLNDAKESRRRDSDADDSASEAALNQEASYSDDPRLSDEDRETAAKETDEFNRKRAEEDAAEARRERRRTKISNGIDAVAATLPGIAAQTAGDVFGSIRTLTNAFLSGGPMTMSSKILGEVMSDTSAIENRMSTLHRQYGIMEESDPRLTADTVKGRMMRAATREEMEGIAYANSNIDLMLRNLGEDPSKMNEDSLKAVCSGIDRETSRLSEELRTGRDKDGNKLNNRQRRVRQAQLRQYNEALTGINKKAAEAKRYAREDLADAKESDAQYRAWQRGEARKQKDYERSLRDWERGEARKQKDYEREHKAWENENARAKKQYDKDLNDWTKREDARREQKRSDDAYNAGTPEQQRIWDAIGRDVELDEQGIPTDSRHLNRVIQVAADRMRGIESGLAPGEKPEDNEDYRKWKAVLDRTSQVREENKARTMTPEQAEARRLKEESERKAAEEAKRIEDRYNAGTDAQKRIWDVLNDKGVELHENGIPVESRHLSRLKSAVEDRMYARAEELKAAGSDPESDDAYQKLRDIHDRVAEAQAWHAEQNLSPAERERREREARDQEVYDSSNPAQRVVRDLLGKKGLPLTEDGMTKDHSSISTVIRNARAWLDDPANAYSPDRDTVKQVLDLYRKTSLSDKQAENDFYDEVRRLSDGTVSNGSKALNRLSNEYQNSIADWYRKYGIEPGTMPKKSEVDAKTGGLEAYREFCTLYARLIAVDNARSYNAVMNQMGSNKDGVRTMDLDDAEVRSIGLKLKDLQIQDHEARMKGEINPDTPTDYTNAVRGYSFVLGGKSTKVRDSVITRLDELEKEKSDLEYSASKQTVGYEEYNERMPVLNRQINDTRRLIKNLQRMPDVTKPGSVERYRKMINTVDSALGRAGVKGGSGTKQSTVSPTYAKPKTQTFTARTDAPPKVPEGSVHSEGDAGPLSGMQRLAKEIYERGSDETFDADFVWKTMNQLARQVSNGDRISDDALMDIYRGLYDKTDEKTRTELLRTYGDPDKMNDYFDNLRPKQDAPEDVPEVSGDVPETIPDTPEGTPETVPDVPENPDAGDADQSDADAGRPEADQPKGNSQSRKERELKAFKNEIAQADRSTLDRHNNQLWGVFDGLLQTGAFNLDSLDTTYRKLRMVEDQSKKKKMILYSDQDEKGKERKAILDEIENNEDGVVGFYINHLNNLNKQKTIDMENLQNANRGLQSQIDEMSLKYTQIEASINDIVKQIISGGFEPQGAVPPDKEQPAPPADPDNNALKEERKKKRQEYLDNKDAVNKDVRTYQQHLEDKYRGSDKFNEELRKVLTGKLANGPLDTDSHPEMGKFVSEMMDDLVGVFGKKDPQEAREMIDKLLVEAGPKEDHGSLYGRIPGTASNDSRKEIDGALFDLSNFLQSMNICSAKTARENKEKKKGAKKEPKLMHSNIDAVLPAGPIRDAFMKIDDVKSIKKGFTGRKNFLEKLSDELKKEGITEVRKGNQMIYSYSSPDVQDGFLRALNSTLNGKYENSLFETDDGEDDPVLTELANLLYEKYRTDL